MRYHHFAGIRSRHACHMLGYPASDPSRARLLDPATSPVVAWAWGDTSPAAFATATELLRLTMPDEPLLLDLAGVLMDAVVSQWNDDWAISVRELLDFAERELTYELADILADY